MPKIITSSWLLPLLLTILVVSAFASVVLRLSPLPYYLGQIIPYAVFTNILVIAYQLAVVRERVIRTIIYSVIPLALCYLWHIQTA